MRAARPPGAVVDPLAELTAALGPRSGRADDANRFVRPERCRIGRCSGAGGRRCAGRSIQPPASIPCAGGDPWHRPQQVLDETCCGTKLGAGCESWHGPGNARKRRRLYRTGYRAMTYPQSPRSAAGALEPRPSSHRVDRKVQYHYGTIRLQAAIHRAHVLPPQGKSLAPV